MNQLISITTNENDEQLVSGRELHKFIGIEEFEKLFIMVSESKLTMNSSELKRLRSFIKKEYIRKFEGVVYLLDMLDLEIIYTFKTENAREYIESKMMSKIIKKWTCIFPEYKFIESEKKVLSGRIDIYGEEKTTNRPVIIELKIDNKNPTNQLIGYSKYFVNPILIGVTQKPVIKKDKDIEYLLFDEIIGGDLWTN